MGTDLKDIAFREEIEFSDLAGKRLVVDSMNVIFQFLSSIRQMDGSLLTDSKGRTTSHLVGLFSRMTRLKKLGIELAFVFDGKKPELKKKEVERRAELKKQAQAEYEIAKEREDIEAMKKYAARTSVLTKEMIEESKELLKALGFPVIQAPSEGEAQAAHMVKKGDFYAEVSQDYDCLLFGVPRMIQNLTISERKKSKNKLSYEKVKPVIVDLKKTLAQNDLTQDQLIVMGLLVGTDFNIGGIKGIGPKNSLKLVKKYGKDFEGLFEEAGWSRHYDMDWKIVFDTIKHMPVTDDYELKWNNVNRDKIIGLLVEKHEFSRERIEKNLDELEEETKKGKQKGLGDFF
ncbi:TPA: flap endonuclease-1 [Candidatus Woesearchaeota archaeon]|nr:flap endonuclease-1 [Candidatus Woesearchaeota archaeon]HIH39199.1 flap endonuclease-1 [Candidatus Woesearchaeota archaeon]